MSKEFKGILIWSMAVIAFFLWISKFFEPFNLTSAFLFIGAFAFAVEKGGDYFFRKYPDIWAYLKRNKFFALGIMFLIFYNLQKFF